MSIEFPCHACGKALRIDEEHAGECVECCYCGGETVVPGGASPIAAIPETPRDDFAGFLDAVGVGDEGPAVRCRVCGTVKSPHVKVCPHCKDDGTPRPQDAEPGPWRDGPDLVVGPRSDLTQVCPSTNQRPRRTESRQYRVRRKTRLSALNLVAVPLGWVVLTTNCIVVRVRYGISNEAIRRRKRRTAMTTALLVAGLALIVWWTSANLDRERTSSLPAVGGFCMLLAGLFNLRRCREVLFLRATDGPYSRYFGAHPQYLTSLPEWDLSRRTESE